MEKKDSQIFVWGNNKFGQLGIKKEDDLYDVPRQCIFQIQVDKLACGKEHSAILTTDGYLYTMGNNQNGQLGISNRQILFFQSPQLVETLQRFKIVEISCGGFHTAAVTDEGDLFTWGDNSFGQLGVNSFEEFFTPQMVNFSDGDNIFLQVVQVSCGMLHTVILLYDHTVHSFGNGEFGQLGLGDTDNINIPTFIDVLGDKIIQIAAGYQHTLFLSYSGQILSTGFNQQGQLGLGHLKNITIPKDILMHEDVAFKKISASSYSVGLSQKGELYFFGNCAFGQFETPKKYDGGIFLQMSLGFHFGMAIDQQYQVHSWGINNSGQQLMQELDVCVPPNKLFKMSGVMIQQITCGFNYVIAVGETIAKETIQLTPLNKLQLESSKELTSDEIIKRRRLYSDKQKGSQNQSFKQTKQENFSDYGKDLSTKKQKTNNQYTPKEINSNIEQSKYQTQQKAYIQQLPVSIQQITNSNIKSTKNIQKSDNQIKKEEQTKLPPQIHQVQISPSYPFPPNIPLSDDVVQRMIKNKEDTIQQLQNQLAFEQQQYKQQINELIQVHSEESNQYNQSLSQKNDEIERYKNIVQFLENQLNLVNNQIKEILDSNKKLSKEYQYSTSQLKYKEDKYTSVVQQLNRQIKEQQQELNELNQELQKNQN